jgi:hypothetical protein
MNVRNMLAMALLTAACCAIPVLGDLSRPEKPILLPQQPAQAFYVQSAIRYDDGRVAPSEAVCSIQKKDLYFVQPQLSYHAPAVDDCPHGWWTGGVVRRLVSAPFRFLFRRC